MAERINNTIETQINDGNTIVSQIVDNNQPLQTVIQDVPQVQTVLQNGINVSSQINAPFVEVTSVNGKTGDVITEPVVGVFEPNHYYLKNTMISYNDTLYYAKANFTSGNSFNTNDWYAVEATQITVDSALSTTSENPVQNKVITSALNNKVNSSDLAEVASSGSFTDLINVPVFPTVNNATLIIQKNGTTVNTFTANSNTDKTANITVPTKTSEITNDSNYIYSGQTEAVTGGMIAERTIITKNLADSAVISAKIDWPSAKADSDVGDGLGWVYLGQARLTAAASSLTFIFPKKYDNYKVIFGGELASGDNAWNDFRFYNGATALPLDLQVQAIANDLVNYATYTNVVYAINGNCSQYDGINLEMFSVKTSPTQWRKYQGSIYITGNGWRTCRFNGRLRSSTEPDRVTMITGGTYAWGSVLKVWGGDNT